MASTNIKFRKKNMTSIEGYFFSVDEDLDVLLEMTADGSTAFTYPLDTAITTPILSLEHDGVNFWTLQSGTVSTDMWVRRWRIDNYICKLQDTVTLFGGPNHTYSSDAFTVEHYHTTLSGACSSGTVTLPLTEYATKLFSGMYVTLGPNDDGYSETVLVQESEPGFVTLDIPIQYSYEELDLVQFYTTVWLFNNYDGTDNTAGALYEINPYTGQYVRKYRSGAYKNIDAATFYKVNSFSQYGLVDALIYVKASNCLFIDVTRLGTTWSYFGSMVLDNMVKSGGVFTGAINNEFDIAMSDQNIYRLEAGAGVYNYELSTLNPLVASIALEARPAIIVANGTASTTIEATVKDQFFQPVQGRLVTFTENGDGSIIGSSTVNSNENGKATITYRSGTVAGTVQITATITQ